MSGMLVGREAAQECYDDQDPNGSAWGGSNIPSLSDNPPSACGLSILTQPGGANGEPIAPCGDCPIDVTTVCD